MNWHKPAGSISSADYDVVVSPGDPDWVHTGLRVANLAAGESRTIETGDQEFVIVPLAGRRVQVSSEPDEVELVGRTDVFAGPTDVAYVPRGRTLTVTASEPSRVAFCSAVAGSDQRFAVVTLDRVPVELRGAGNASRQVHNFATPAVLQADSIICCEVLTPGGNWSSYPPHKHDEERPGVETELEEIYYFEARTEPGGPASAQPHGYQAVHGTPERPIDVDARVVSGDVVLVPHGWHGPSMAPPGYDLYYLNVMAGPGPERAWRICDDPAHGWVRDTWPDQQLDPRLPFTARDRPRKDRTDGTTNDPEEAR